MTTEEILRAPVIIWTTGLEKIYIPNGAQIMPKNHVHIANPTSIYIDGQLMAHVNQATTRILEESDAS